MNPNFVSKEAVRALVEHGLAKRFERAAIGEPEVVDVYDPPTGLFRTEPRAAVTLVMGELPAGRVLVARHRGSHTRFDAVVLTEEELLALADEVRARRAFR